MGGPPWPLPVALLAAAAVAQVVGLATLAGAASDIADGVWYGPSQLAAAHLLGLGFLSLAIVGALLQLVPVLLRRRLGPTRVMAGAGGALGIGAWAMAVGFWTDAPGLIAAGGGLAVGALVVVLVALGRVLVAVRGDRGSRDVQAGIALAAGWLLATLVLGGLMAGDRTVSFLEVDRTGLIGAHALIAAGGWVGGTILAIALRLAPMFALAHGHRRSTGIAAMAAWHAGVALAAGGLFAGAPPATAAGAVTLTGGGVLAGAFLLDVARHRRRHIEAPLFHLGIGAFAAATAPAVALGWSAAGATGTGAALAALLVVVGLGTGVTSGHLFKVVPMLVWTGRYARLAGTPGAPRLADMYPSRLAVAEQTLFMAGLVTLIAGVAGGWPALVGAGALTLAAAACCVLTAIGICALGTARAAPAPHRAPPTTATKGPA